MAKTAKKRGRKPGVKVGPYVKSTYSLKQMAQEIKELKAKVAKLEKVLG